MKAGQLGALAPALLLCCGCQSEPSAPPPGGPCTESLDLRAYAEDTATSSGVRIFGEARAEAGTTVRAVLVAGQEAPLSVFNYRGFQVDLSQDVLEAVAENGVASISVIAHTSTGCAELPEADQPKVKVSSDPAAGGAGGEAGGPM